MVALVTIAEAYSEICQGERPWTALGNFLNEWFDSSKEDRAVLISELITLPLARTDEQYRWAAFCVASVEWLCVLDVFPCPRWVGEMTLVLPEPWFHAFHPENPAVRQRLMQQTPAPFALRNIYCGNRMFANKYEFARHISASKN